MAPWWGVGVGLQGQTLCLSVSLLPQTLALTLRLKLCSSYT